MRKSITALLFILSAHVLSASVPGDFQEGRIKDSVRIDDILVTGSRAYVTTNNLPMSVSVATGAQLEGRMEQSVLPLLVERVPSLMITSRGVMGYGASTGAAGAMTMRGIGGGAGMLMLIDGHPQFMGIFSHPLSDTYQTIMAERVEVVRGPASVLYGQNAMGGVMNIITRRQSEDGINTSARAMFGSFNTLSAEAVNLIRSGGFNSVLSAGYNRSDGHRPNMEYEQLSGYVKAGYDFSKHWKAFADLNISHSDSSNPGAVVSPMFDNDMDILRGIASVSLSNEYDRTGGAVKIFYNFGDHYINDGYSEGEPARVDRFNSTDWMLGVTAFQNYSLWQGNQTTVGVDFQRYGGHAWNSFINGAEDSEMSERYMSDIAGYLNFQQLLWEKLTLNAGIRFDRHSVTGNQWIPQLGVSWFAARNTTVKGIVSKGYRNPTMRELYMWRPANPELKPEELMNYEVSVGQHLLGGKLALELNLYYIKGRNSIIETPYVDRNGASRWRWDNTGEVENYGLEFSANYRIRPNLTVLANYSYLHMEYEIAAAPRHKLYAGADWTPGKWTLSTGLQYVGDLVTAAPDNINGTPPEKDSFLLWSARVSYKAARWASLFVRGENLLGQRYEMYKGYPMPGATVMGGVAFRF